MRNRRNGHTPRDLLGKRRDGRTTTQSTDRLLDDRPERAFLVSILLPNTKADLNAPLDELTALAESAGTVVIDALLQKRTAMTPGYALGKGKLEELARRVEETDADVVIFDNDLSPRQIRGLERVVGVKIIDRSELILDIFAARAKTREAQLQVELAQLEYTAPRLRGMWTHLERIAGAGGGTSAGAVGGVGTRGPGERQIEIDRRIVKDRIAHLKREIDTIDRRKTREVQARQLQFTVALVGYTNSGKTTLLNKLTGAEQYAADKLFATLDTKTVRWSLGNGREVLLSDTVGFVRDLPHDLVASFRATLEQTIHADLLLHMVDVSSRAAWQQMEAVDEVLRSLGCDKLPQINVLNKIDIADDGTMVELLSRKQAKSVPISALTGEGLDVLRCTVLERLESDAMEVTVRIPHALGRVLPEIDRLGHVRDRRYVADGVEVDVRINRAPFLQLRGRYPDISLVSGNVSGLEPADSGTSP